MAVTLKAGDEPGGSSAPIFWLVYVLSMLPEVTWISAPVGADGDELGEAVGVPDGAGDTRRWERSSARPSPE